MKQKPSTRKKLRSLAAIRREAFNRGWERGYSEGHTDGYNQGVAHERSKNLEPVKAADSNPWPRLAAWVKRVFNRLKA